MIYQGIVTILDESDAHSIQNKYTENSICENNIIAREFCAVISEKWIIKSLRSLSNTENENEKLIDDIMKLQSRCRTQCDFLLYSYFLYFSGIIPFIKDKDELRKFFDFIIQHTTDRNHKMFFKFLKIYIDIIDPSIEDIKLFEELKYCLSNDNSNIIFDTLEREHALTMKIIRETSSFRADARANSLKKILPKDKRIKETKAFEEDERKTIEEYQNDIIDSFLHAGLARLYLLLGIVINIRSS